MKPLDYNGFDLYDDSGAIENALVAVIVADPAAPSACAIYTSLDDPELQRKRPRIEIVFSAGAGQHRLVRLNDPTLRPAPGCLPDSAFKGQLKIEIITAAVITIHTAYRVYARRLMATVVPDLNDGKKLPLWMIDSISFGGMTPRYAPETGVYQSTALYDVDYQLCMADGQPAVSGPEAGPAQFPFASMNGQIIPLVNDTGNLQTVKIWDPGLKEWRYLRTIKGQMVNESS